MSQNLFLKDFVCNVIKKFDSVNEIKQKNSFMSQNLKDFVRNVIKKFAFVNKIKQKNSFLSQNLFLKDFIRIVIKKFDFVNKFKQKICNMSQMRIYWDTLLLKILTKFVIFWIFARAISEGTSNAFRRGLEFTT